MRAWAAILLLMMSAACAAPRAQAPDPADRPHARDQFLRVGRLPQVVVRGQVEIMSAWTAQVAAWNRGDLEGYMAAYWKSPDLVFFSNGSETRGWQQTLDRYRARYQGPGKQMGALDFPQLDLVMLGTDAALMRGRWRLKMPDGKELTGMTSVIFRKLPDGWRIVHDHSSSAASN